VDSIAESAHGSYSGKGVRVFNLNLGEFMSEMGAHLGFDENPALRAFNPINQTTLGHPKHIAACLIAILNGSSRWPAGSSILIDNHLTVDAKSLFLCSVGRSLRFSLLSGTSMRI
jgi:hypothetical protein